MTVLMPPEWAPQDWVWIGFPHLADEWPGWLGAAQEQIAAFANAVAQSGQDVRLLVRDRANKARKIIDMTIGMVIDQPIAQPQEPFKAQLGAKCRLNLIA